MPTVDKLLRHFGFTALPFDRAVPPEGLLHHPSFDEALERLRFAVDARGPALVVGAARHRQVDPLRHAVHRAGRDPRPRHRHRAHRVRAVRLARPARRALRHPVRRTTAQTAAALLAELATSPKTELLILDEAHRLPDASLEELRLLGQLDFDRRAPFVLLLGGQPALRERLQQPEFDALGQRLVVRTSLAPLTDRQSAEYLERRPRAVGARAALFRPGAGDLLFQHSRGIMRRLNTLATGALLAAARAGRKHVDSADVQAAVFDDEHA